MYYNQKYLEKHGDKKVFVLFIVIYYFSLHQMVVVVDIDYYYMKQVDLAILQSGVSIWKPRKWRRGL